MDQLLRQKLVESKADVTLYYTHAQNLKRKSSDQEGKAG